MAVNRFFLIISAAVLVFSLESQETLRGRFDIDLEPASAMEPGVPYPLDQTTAHRRALDEAARVFAAMIYGWNFDYELGNRSRSIEDSFALEPIGSIPFGDPRLSITDAVTENSILKIWAEYRMDESQQRAFFVVREGAARLSQGTGSAPLSRGTAGKTDALRNAAKAAVGSVLAGTERNRPKEAYGTATLLEVPRYWVNAGRYECSARFRINVKEIVSHQFF